MMRMMSFMTDFRWSLSTFLVLGLTACTTPQDVQQKQIRQLTPVEYSDLTGWNEDDQKQALLAFAKSCERLLKADENKAFGDLGQYKDWQNPCRNLPSSGKAQPQDARLFFETYFTPYSASNGNGDRDDTGLFTGYYEASLKGALTKNGPYQTPLLARPDDLIMVNLGDFRKELKGQRIAGRASGGYLKPYETRAEIEQGNLPESAEKPLYWIDNPVDVFFLQVQGSGIVTLPDGSTQRVGYDGQNGHPYSAIGRDLVTRGALTKDQVSMQAIREWLAQHPSEAPEVMRSNLSYIFFKQLDTDGPVGAEGLVLTPERSLAIDHSIWPYGIPLFVAAKNPLHEEPDLQQLMIAQDTGGAIIGVVRGDFFWGYGDKATQKAGLMKSEGRMWALVPKTVEVK